MATDDQYERAGKRLLLGLHRAGQSFTHGAGSMVDGMTAGQLNVAGAFDQFTGQVGVAYAELDALPSDSPEGRYVAAAKEWEEKQAAARESSPPSAAAAAAAADDVAYWRRSLANPNLDPLLRAHYQDLLRKAGETA